MDWSANDVADPNYCWGFNRMEWWPHYAAAYTADPAGNARYAGALFAELADWLATSPVSLTYFPLQPGDRWRHLEVAIRSGFNWPIVFALVKNSPLLSDDLLVDWIKSFYVHARHLEVNAELFTNRGSGEAIALYVVGVLFPEFMDSPDWVRLLAPPSIVAAVENPACLAAPLVSTVATGTPSAVIAAVPPCGCSR